MYKIRRLIRKHLFLENADNITGMRIAFSKNERHILAESIKSSDKEKEQLYKLLSKDYFSDLAMGLGMFLKGKITPFGPRTRNMAAVRKIFKETKHS